MAARHVYLVRHGQYRVESGDGFDMDGSLTAVGREQAALTAEALRIYPVSTVYSSPLRRAVETAEFIASTFDLSVQMVPELREVIPVIPADLTDFFAQNMPELTPDVVADQKQAADSIFDRFFGLPDADNTTHEVLVCHGNIIQYLACLVMGAPGDLWLNMDVYHCSITRCTMGASGRRHLVSLNLAAG